MKVEKIKLLRGQVKKQILLDKGVEDFLMEIAQKGAEDAEDMLDDSYKSEPGYDPESYMNDVPTKIFPERQENRQNRVAVDIVADRTNEVVQNHVLEKALEGL
jgi:hypothetical protein